MSAPWRTTWWGSPINSYKMLLMQLEILLKILYCKKIRNNKKLKNQWCGSGFFSSSASLKNWRLLLLPLPCFQITSEKLLMKWNNMGSFFARIQSMYFLNSLPNSTKITFSVISFGPHLGKNNKKHYVALFQSLWKDLFFCYIYQLVLCLEQIPREKGAFCQNTTLTFWNVFSLNQHYNSILVKIEL